MYKKILVPLSGILVGGTAGMFIVRHFTSVGDKTIKISRKIINPLDKSGLNLALYQYQTCPFCSKTRAFLDYYGFSYDVIEVNPLFKNQLEFSEYKKVPILVAKGQDDINLVDSSLIVSVLRTYLLDTKQKLADILKLYPPVITKSPKENRQHIKPEDFYNKYDIMFGSEEDIKKRDHEKKWRIWVDDHMVHLLSPNLYRTLSESYKSFKYFSKVGEWEKNFKKLDNVLAIYVGSFAMFLLGKKLKNRYNLKEDVRESLYDGCNEWLSEIKSHQLSFMGGHYPDLSDLAMYGIISSFEGTQTFKDMMTHTELGSWFKEMQHQVTQHKGSKLLEYNLTLK